MVSMENGENVGKESKKEILIIIPAYNEEKTIVSLLEKLEQPEIAQVADVLVMNDASQDATNHVTKKRKHDVVTHVFNLGYGSGLQLGYKYAVRKGYRWMQMVNMMCATFRESIKNCRRKMKMEHCRILSLDQDSWKEVLNSRFHLPKRLHLYGSV